MTKDSLAFPAKHNAFLMLNFCYTFAVFPGRTNVQRCSGGCVSRVGCDCLSTIKSADGRIRRGEHQTSDIKLRSRGFTLLEMLIVMGIIAILMVLLAPAFTSIKSGTDVTSAAYTIKGVLDQARTYAMANNTYTWVGLYEEDASQPSTNPATPGTGRVVLSIVASKDGTTVYTGALTSPATELDPTRLVQLGKL